MRSGACLSFSGKPTRSEAGLQVLWADLIVVGDPCFKLHRQVRRAAADLSLPVYLLRRSHFGYCFLDGLFRNSMSDESLAELLDGTVLFPLRFPFGQVLAETIGDVCTDECLIAFEANRRGDLLEILNYVIW